MTNQITLLWDNIITATNCQSISMQFNANILEAEDTIPHSTQGPNPQYLTLYSTPGHYPLYPLLYSTRGCYPQYSPPLTLAQVQINIICTAAEIPWPLVESLLPDATSLCQFLLLFFLFYWHLSICHTDLWHQKGLYSSVLVWYCLMKKFLLPLMKWNISRLQ